MGKRNGHGKHSLNTQHPNHLFKSFRKQLHIIQIYGRKHNFNNLVGVVSNIFIN